VQFSMLVEPAKKKQSFKPRDFFPGWNHLEYAVFRGFLALVNALPFSVSAWIARQVGNLLYFTMTKRRQVTLDNLERAYGDAMPEAERKRVARLSFQHLITSLMEFFRIPRTLKDARERFEFTGTEHLDKAFARGHGVLLVISHFGSWEYLAFLPNLRDYPFSVIARSTKNPFITKWMQSMRAATKLVNIDKKNAAKPVLQELKNNRGVAILIDQWAGNDGEWVNFFGTKTSTTTIPARLAKRTKAALVPAYCVRTGDGRYRIEIHPEVSFAADEENGVVIMTQTLNDLLEKRIREKPQQWTWTHRRWKEDLRPKQNLPPSE